VGYPRRRAGANHATRREFLEHNGVVLTENREDQRLRNFCSSNVHLTLAHAIGSSFSKSQRQAARRLLPSRTSRLPSRTISGSISPPFLRDKLASIERQLTDHYFFGFDAASRRTRAIHNAFRGAAAFHQHAEHRRCFYLATLLQQTG